MRSKVFSIFYCRFRFGKEVNLKSLKYLDVNHNSIFEFFLYLSLSLSFQIHLSFVYNCFSCRHINWYFLFISYWGIGVSVGRRPIAALTRWMYPEKYAKSTRTSKEKFLTSGSETQPQFIVSSWNSPKQSTNHRGKKKAKKNELINIIYFWTNLFDIYYVNGIYWY